MKSLSTPGKRKGKHDWAYIKETFIESYIQKRPLTLAALGLKFGIDYQYLRNRSSSEKWIDEVKTRLKSFDSEVAKRLAEIRSKVTAELQEEFIGGELEIRTRHAKWARGLQSKGIQKLSAMDPEDLKPMEALALVEFGMREERRAMGMAETYEKPSQDGKIHPEYKSVIEQDAEHVKVQKRAVTLLEMFKRAKEEGGANEALEPPPKALELKPGDHATDITKEGSHELVPAKTQAA